MRNEKIIFHLKKQLKDQILQIYSNNKSLKYLNFGF